MACVFDTRPAPRRPHDVVHPPGGRSSERPARPGPRAENKWCTASLVRSPEQVIADAFDQAQAPKHLRPWIVLVDGARHQLDLITAESIRRGVTLHVLLDFVHVAEYVWAAAHTFHKPGTTEAKEWATDHLTAILTGHAARTADQMTAQADRESLSIAPREAVDACQRYLVGYLNQLHYNTALAGGRPIATEAVEGTCRHLIADRLDITGARWAFTEPKPSSGSAPSSPTATSTHTGATISPANTSASTPPPTSGTTPSPRDCKLQSEPSADSPPGGRNAVVHRVGPALELREEHAGQQDVTRPLRAQHEAEFV
ncbi:hypothetical protein OK006_11148 [Actinobacteria bacterium OK006]|nr:hypothetical protein OK006_11148 [Actinobacteria bacterium OK006]